MKKTIILLTTLLLFSFTTIIASEAKSVASEAKSVAMLVRFSKEITRNILILNVFQDEKNIDIQFNYREEYKVEIYDEITGVTLLQKSYGGISESQLNIEHLPNGNYIIKIIVEEGYAIGYFDINK